MPRRLASPSYDFFAKSAAWVRHRTSSWVGLLRRHSGVQGEALGEGQLDGRLPREWFECRPVIATTNAAAQGKVMQSTTKSRSPHLPDKQAVACVVDSTRLTHSRIASIALRRGDFPASVTGSRRRIPACRRGKDFSARGRDRGAMQGPVGSHLADDRAELDAVAASSCGSDESGLGWIDRTDQRPMIR